jgi:hypothetical protein
VEQKNPRYEFLLGGRAMSEFCRAILCFFLMLPVAALSQTFEKINIKSANTADPRNMRLQVLPSGELSARAVPVITLLSYAYDLPSNSSPRLLLLPDWAVVERYDIEAKAPVDKSSVYRYIRPPGRKAVLL